MSSSPSLYVMQYFAFLQSDTLICRNISQSAKCRHIVYLMDSPSVLHRSCADTICMWNVCLCVYDHEGGFALDLLNDVCGEGFLLTPFNH